MYTYPIDNNEATITSCDRSVSGYITIPSTLDGYPVTTIGATSFAYCSNLTDLTITNSVITIEKEAFIRCTNL